MSLEDYEWPETTDKDGNTNNGRCEGPCKMIRELQDGVCKGCTLDAVAARHDEESDGVMELFTDEDFRELAIEGVKE